MKYIFQATLEKTYSEIYISIIKSVGKEVIVYFQSFVLLNGPRSRKLTTIKTLITFTESPLYPFSTMENPFPMANILPQSQGYYHRRQLWYDWWYLRKRIKPLRKAINDKVKAKANANANIRLTSNRQVWQVTSPTKIVINLNHGHPYRNQWKRIGTKH